MKHIIILGDGMADHKVERLGGKTPLQYAATPYMDKIAGMGRCGRLITIPDGYLPGSEVANTTIMGYDLNKVYEGRGPLEAASIGYEMANDEMAIRCNIITLADGKIKNHHGTHLTTDDAKEMIAYLNEHLGNDRVKFITGIQYRHLMIIKGGNKRIDCAPPHDWVESSWRERLVKPEAGYKPNLCEDGCIENGIVRMTPQETADLINNLIIKSQALLEQHPINIRRKEEGKMPANSIWPWSGGYRPSMQTLRQLYPQVSSGSVISAVDLIKGIGHYAGLDIVEVEGATGLYDTNYEGKAQAAIEALRKQDFVFLHVEASDEAGHDGNVNLKVRTIEYLDSRIIGPIFNEVEKWDEPVCIAILPDHPTPVETRNHVNEPVPFIIYYKGIEPDEVKTYDEQTCVGGTYGMLRLNEFMKEFMTIQ